jgi:hypothetical protein
MVAMEWQLGGGRYCRSVWWRAHADSNSDANSYTNPHSDADSNTDAYTYSNAVSDSVG